MSAYSKPVAFSCHDGEDSWAVVHAISHSQARHFAASEIGCGFIDIQTCRRAPYADGLSGDEQNRAMVEQGGWHYECAQCSEEVSTDSQIASDIVYRRDLVFCSKECCADFDDDIEKDRLEKEAMIAEVIKAFPGADVMHVSCNKASFTLPGMKRSINWTIGEKECSMAQEDVSAFEEYKARRKAEEFKDSKK
ncbi:hypothetical protein phiPLPE_24 [Iodobacter phage PhiPLPE]|uniref:Uncharacterized protein n=1 Tax=Iodobacter phage PhiPLPE TaxID=551895 RepID=B5AX43_9CAUD|nr:hypothetical protein phiPLPE_24 [Iodobacter phage PhiPLPE]ACG60346.1 hypothetical protein phiPLPE_24 [Iodobacter phage PhiPLPE]